MSETQMDFVSELDVCNTRLEDFFKKTRNLCGLVFWTDTIRDIIRDIKKERKQAYEKLMLADLALSELSADERIQKALSYIADAKNLMVFTTLFTAFALFYVGEETRRVGSRAARVPARREALA